MISRKTIHLPKVQDGAFGRHTRQSTLKPLCFICIALLLVVSTLPALSSCSSSTGNSASSDNKVTITVSYSNAGGTQSYIAFLKEKFQDINIEMQGMPLWADTASYGNDLLSYQSQHGVAADITISDELSKELPSLETTFADLSGKSYTSRFKKSYLNDASIGGKVYYLPLTLDLKGVVCNTTALEEHGWSIPTNYQEFATLLEQIDSATDMQPLIDENIGATSAYWLQTYYALNEGSKLPGYINLQEFNAGNLSAKDMKMDHMLDYMKLLADTGSLTPDSFSATLDLAHVRLAEGSAVMALASSSTLSTLSSRGRGADFTVIPLYSPDFPEGFLLEQSAVNLAVSQAAQDDTRKSAAIDEILDYVTSKDGQRALLEYTFGVKSPCYGIMNTSDRAFLADVSSLLDNGYLVQSYPFEDVDSSEDATLFAYLFDNDDQHVSNLDVQQAIDNARQSGRIANVENESTLTTASADFTKEQTKYLLLKAMAEQSGCDFAVLPNTQGSQSFGILQTSEALASNIYEGSLSIANIHALINIESTLITCEVTGQQLLDIMDYNGAVRMLYGATMVYTYDSVKDTYRTTGAMLPDGSELDLSKTYTLAYSSQTSLAEGQYTQPTLLEATLAETLVNYCRDKDSISPENAPAAIFVK